MALYDRDPECALIDRLIDEARAGRSGVLVLRGEPGLGKSSLLGYAVGRARGLRVLACRGFEAESQLAFAALSDVLRPLVGGFEALPDPQRKALEGVLSIGPLAMADRLTVNIGVLSVLAAAAESESVLVTIDDAQWLDAASLEALAFAARRLDADGIGILVAARADGATPFDADAFPSVELQPIGRAAARRLLEEHSDTRGESMQRVLELAGGNPLAVLELSAHATDDGDPFDPTTLPPGRVQDAFAKRLAALPPGTRAALLVVAVASEADALLLGRALAVDGRTLGALEPAEEARLVRFADGGVEFCHPLARAAVSAAAPPAERRAAHAAVAAAMPGPEHEDARAWHLAEAALEPDSAVAEALERSAARARSIGAYATAVDVLRRSAGLSPKPADRVRRLCTAAEIAYASGDTPAARGLLAVAAKGVTAPASVAEIEHLLGRVEARGGSPTRAYDLFSSAAQRIEAASPVVAALSLVEAVEQCIRAGLPARGLETAERATALIEDPSSPPAVFATLGRAAACIFLGDSAAAATLIATAAKAADAAALDAQLRAYLGMVLAFDEQMGAARAVLAPLVDQARAHSASGGLVFPLISLGWIDRSLGRWPQATAGLSEAAQIAAEGGRPNDECWALSVLAWIEAARGQSQACFEHCRRQLDLHEQLGLPYQLAAAEAALGSLALGAGEYEPAIAHLEAALTAKREHGYCDATTYPRVTPDLVEAYIRLGRASDAVAVFEPFEADARSSARPSALALAARCQGLLDPNTSFEPALDRALELHAAAPDPFARARTELCFGELLRRRRRRERSREVLRAAVEAFESLGAEPWAARARSELQASGATLRRRDDEGANDLTPQEWQIAALVAQGLTNKEVGARAFISPKTVESHLTRIYSKLGVRSRAALAHALPGLQSSAVG
jgi:DNA-binding CsgD family transcriptional regulator